MAKLKTKKIPLTRQPQDRWYEVDMQFSIDTGMKTMDDLLKQCRMDDTLPTVQNAGVVNVKQVIPFVPDDDYIAPRTRPTRPTSSFGPPNSSDTRAFMLSSRRTARTRKSPTCKPKYP